MARGEVLIDKVSDLKAIDGKEDWKIAVRRRWWLMGPSFAIGVAALIVALLWPPSYRSEAMILLEQQKIPTKYVTPNVVSDLDGRLKSMTQELLSRTRLHSLIKQLNLFPRHAPDCYQITH